MWENIQKSHLCLIVEKDNNDYGWVIHGNVTLHLFELKSKCITLKKTFISTK